MCQSPPVIKFLWFVCQGLYHILCEKVQVLLYLLITFRLLCDVSYVFEEELPQGGVKLFVVGLAIIPPLSVHAHSSRADISSLTCEYSVPYAVGAPWGKATGTYDRLHGFIVRVDGLLAGCTLLRDKGEEFGSYQL